MGSNSPACRRPSQYLTITEALFVLMSPLPLNSCMVRFTCTVERPVAYPTAKAAEGSRDRADEDTSAANVLMRRLAKMLLEPARKPEAAKGK